MLSRSLRALARGAAAPRALMSSDAKAAAKAAKMSKPYVPVDKAAISPIRGLFYGDLTSYQKNFLPFPSSLSAAESESLAAMVDPVAKFMATVPSAQIDKDAKIPEEVLASLRELGLWGLQVPEELGGLGLSNTGYARMVEELVMDPSIAVTLMAHQSIGFKGLLLCGTEAQKAKYLPKLASGEHIAAFALTEPTVGSDASSVTLTALPTPDGKGFVLNGQKMWISNGPRADIMTVFARTPAETAGEWKMTAFIVERAFGGVTSGPPEKKLGIRGSETSVVNFDGCVVPRENVLGEVNGGFKVAMMILNNGRFGMGAATGGGIRRLIAQAADYANNRKQFGMPIANFGLIRAKFAKMATDAYAIESMAYATTAQIDKGMDCSLEAAACKIYGSEAMFAALNECIQILGGMGFSAGGVYPFERLMRDSRILLIFEGTNEILRLFIALTAMQGAGAELKHLMKSPLGNLGELVPMLLRTRLGVGLPVLSGITPQLSSEAAALPAAVAEFQGAVQALLQRYGAKIIEPDNQLLVARAANAAIDLYGWQCVMSRATAAVSGGNGHTKVANPQHELALAKAWIADARRRIAVNVKDMKAGSAANGDAATIAVAKETLEAGKYIAEHPLRI